MNSAVCLAILLTAGDDTPAGDLRDAIAPLARTGLLIERAHPAPCGVRRDHRPPGARVCGAGRADRQDRTSAKSAVCYPQQLLQRRQLYPRPPMRLAGGSLESVDGLPVLGGDEFRLTGGQPFGELVGVAVPEISQPRLPGSGQVGQQGVDGVLGVLLVGADHAGWAAL